jgi:glycosyltransferase involved in cell wall biosynthesis
VLAIVIPYFKSSFFDETMSSLANQTDKRFKVYIGDDASPDDPKLLLEKYINKFDFQYHRFNENLGGISLSKQWERCIALIDNESWLMVLGDDDIIDENVIASFYENLRIFDHKTNVVRYATKKIFGRTIDTTNSFTHPVWENATDAFYRKFNKTSRSSLSEYIFLRKAYEKFGFYNYPLAWNSDDRAWLDFSDGKPLYTINTSFVYFRKSDINITGRNDNLILKNKSEIEFYKFVIYNKLMHYNNDQKLRLLRRYQAEIRRFRGLKISEFFTLVFFYVKYLNLIWIKKFFKKIFRKIFYSKSKQNG